jgi:VWFA-related protein
MNGRLAPALIAALTCASASAPLPAAVQQPTFRAGTEMVLVTASVLSGRNPVTGLQPADFIVTDNGVRQTVDSVVSDNVALDLTIVLTAFSHDRRVAWIRALDSAEKISGLLLPADRLRVVWVDDDVRSELVGADHSLLSSPPVVAWASLPRVGTNPANHAVHPAGRSGWGVALADGLFQALAWPIDPDRRHLVVAFTDGYDTQSILEMDRLPVLAGRSDAVLHAVFWMMPSRTGGGGGWHLPRGLIGMNFDAWQDGYQIIDEVVQLTGGTIQRPESAPDALGRIVADFRSSYVVRYRPQGVKAGGWHKLEVKIARPGSFKIRARKGYEG